MCVLDGVVPKKSLSAVRGVDRNGSGRHICLESGHGAPLDQAEMGLDPLLSNAL